MTTASASSAATPAGLCQRWQDLRFAPAPLTRLAVFRIGIAILALWDVMGYGHLVFPEAAALSRGAATRPWSPIYLFDVLGLQPIDLDTATTIYRILLGAIGCMVVGLFSRTACLVAALLGLYWTGLAYSFGKPHHDRVALTFAMLALPLAPVGARLSIDSLLRGWRRRDGSPPPTLGAGAALPLRFTQVTVALGYFLAGASKLWIGGLGWWNGYTLQGIMMGHDNAWSAFFSQSVLATQVMSIGLVFTQFTFPLVFVWPRLRWFYLPAATSMHLITWRTMDTGPYISLWLTMIAFLPLEQIPAAVRTALRTGSWPKRVAAGAGCLLVVTLVGGILLERFPLWLQLTLAVPALALAARSLSRPLSPAA